VSWQLQIEIILIGAIDKLRAVLPKAPSSLLVEAFRGAVPLLGKDNGDVIVERRLGDRAWERIAKLPPTASHYDDRSAPATGMPSCRVRTTDETGECAHSNFVHTNVYAGVSPVSRAALSGVELWWRT
jgi:hypothetical protein